MMKLRNSFLMRCLSLALALVLVVSNVTPGIALRASAAGLSKTAGEIMAENYDLSEAEKNLLASGYLAGDYTVEYDGVQDGWVAVDSDSKKITAEEKDGWKAVSANIVVNGESVETVTMNNGVGTYTYTGNAFSVKVNYELKKNVEGQQTMLDGIVALKNAIANANVVSGQSGNLYILEQAMPQLVDLANNGIALGSMGTATLDATSKAAVNALNGQMTANGGQLNLSVMAAAYDADSKTHYVSAMGDEMAAEVQSLLSNVSAINVSLNTVAGTLESLVNWGIVDAETAQMVKTLVGVCANLETGLASVPADWNAEGHVNAGANYAELDTLLANVGNISISVTNPLVVDKATVQFNMSMKNVTVEVVLNVVEDKADSDELVQYGDTYTGVLTLSDGAEADEIRAEANAVVKAALATWGEDYVDGQFEATYSELPESLTEDITYTVTYSPKIYTISGYTEMEVPYGYQHTLAALEGEEGKNYQYTIDGNTYYGGDIVTILGDTVIDRADEIKEVQSYKLYTVVSNNYGNEVIKNILQSGALFGDKSFVVAKPDPKNPQAYVTLKEGKLTVAESVNADYQGLKWVPYSYGATGTEDKFDGQTTVTWTGKDVKAVYRLDLTNFDAVSVIKLAKDLKAEAADQKGAMDSLAGMEATLAQLSKTTLGALNGVIDVTDFSDDAAENDRIRKEMKKVVSNIINNNLEGNSLRIYNMVLEYNAKGLKYYYENYQSIKNEIETLAGYMTELMDNEEALRIMCNAAGYGEYADKISDVEGKLNDYNARLSTPNEAINLKSDKLDILVNALTASGEAVGEATGYAYLESEKLTAMDSSSVMVQVIIDVPSKGLMDNVDTGALDRGTVLSQSNINDLKDQVDAKVAELLGTNAKYYTVTVEGSLDAVVGVELMETVNVKYTYAPKSYTVEIEGEADQKITIENLVAKLPAHPTAGWKYIYTVAGEELTEGAESYTFTAAQLDSLFADGPVTITRREINKVEVDFDESFGDWFDKDENGNITDENGNPQLTAHLDTSMGSIMDFVTTLAMNGNYDYIGLNGEGLLYFDEESNTSVVSIQTLINAILNDNTFGIDTLINLGKNGGGKLLETTMTVRNGAPATYGLRSSQTEYGYENVNFKIVMDSIPGSIAELLKSLEKIKPYMTFQSNNGILEIKLNLPEKVYKAYLTALLATGEVAENNIATINSEIAFEFLWDYIEIITKSEADTETFTNTLSKLGQSYDLTGYEKYYQLVKKALTNEGVVINPVDDNDVVDISVTAEGPEAINGIIKLVGFDTTGFDTYLNMIKEYKSGNISVSASAELVGVGADYEAFVIDIDAAGMTNKVDYTTKVAEKKFAGSAMVMLLDNVTGNLNFKGTSILDLNGKTVNGSINTTGTLFIVDSSLVTDSGAGVTGSISGNVTILGGKYAPLNSSFLKSGYHQVEGVVQNKLYNVTGSETNMVFNLNTDVIGEEISYITFAKAVAMDVAVDIILNYYNAASLSVNGNNLYSLGVTASDLFAILGDANTADYLINKVLGSVDVPGMSDLVNDILDQLLNFADLEAKIGAGDPILTNTFTTAPWGLYVDHNTEEDYIDFGVVANSENSKSITVSMYFAGENVKYVEKVVGELASVAQGTDIEIDVKQPVYGNKLFEVEGSADVTIMLDLTNRDIYLDVLTVILAQGDKSVVDPLNAGDKVALKAAYDVLTVKDIADALKAVNKSDTLESLASKAGINFNVSTEKWAQMEKIFILMVSGAGKVLEELGINGNNSKLGSLDKDGDGTYTYVLSIEDKSKEVTKYVRGYGVNATAIGSVYVSVNLFGETEKHDCVIGDANHDNIIDILDLIYVRRLVSEGNADENAICNYCADVNEDGTIDIMDIIALRKMLSEGVN